MTTELAQRRKGRALSWAVAAIAAAGIAAVTLAIEVRSAAPDRIVGPVVPGLAGRLAEAQKITIVSPDARYRIAKTAKGWAMTDRGDFPVRAARLAQLTSGLTNLAFVRRMTSNPERHARLGVTDPAQGGNGVLVQIENARGAFLVNLILGVQRDAIYARKPGDNQVWAVRGELPPLRDASIWLDLQPLTLAPDTLRRVEIVPNQGRPYILERASADAPFAFAGALAGREPISAAALSDAAEHLTRVQPTDVLPAPTVQGPPSARVRATTADGALIDAELITHGDRVWLKLAARAERPEAQATVDPINARASAWAYAISPNDFERLTPALESLLRNPAPAPADAPQSPAPQAEKN
ncbi:MAG: DUF4340 domain-containing protein [Hyphomonadaceae bacterium]|nr:DUF4340 domain-containing protein [Hyphomonadaceae bacterium]